jgi:hypothetical protein
VAGALAAPDLRGKGRAAKAERSRVIDDPHGRVARRGDPTQQAKGWQVGSGSADRAGKAVIEMLLKGGGRRRGDGGALARRLPRRQRARGRLRESQLKSLRPLHVTLTPRAPERGAKKSRAL